MWQIKNSVLLVTITFFLCQCGHKQQEKDPKLTALEKLDTLILDPASSTLVLKRTRVFTNKYQNLQWGKTTSGINISDLTAAVDATYKIDSGKLIYNDKVFTLFCYLNTKQNIKPVIVQSNQLTIQTPGHLFERSPQLVFEYKGNFYPREQAPTASCYLNTSIDTNLLNEATHKIYCKRNSNIIKKITTAFYINGLHWNLFEKEPHREIQKDSVNGKLTLVFK